MTQLADITPRGKTIRPESRLIGDLGFDSLAFSQLEVLLAESYQSRGASAAALRDNSTLTVEAIYRRFVVGGR
jgi:acyl carrier protein